MSILNKIKKLYDLNKKTDDLHSLTEYMKKVKEVGKPTSSIKPFRFYAYIYHYLEDYPEEELQFYDKMPLSYICDVDYSTKKNGESGYFVGINLHHAPPFQRMKWIKAVLKGRSLVDLFKQSLRGDTVKISYSKSVSVYRPTKLLVRQYKMERVVRAYEIPQNKIAELSRYFANTYHDVSVQKKFFDFLNKVGTLS
jgi:hypothetical protein